MVRVFAAAAAAPPCRLGSGLGGLQVEAAYVLELLTRDKDSRHTLLAVRNQSY